jgi:hypothetical protein
MGRPFSFGIGILFAAMARHAQIARGLNALVKTAF